MDEKLDPFFGEDRMVPINYQAIDLIEIRQQATNLLFKAGLWGQFPLPLDKLALYLGYEVKVFEPTPDIAKVSGTVSKQKTSILLNGKAERSQLMQQFNCSEIEAVNMISREMLKANK